MCQGKQEMSLIDELGRKKERKVSEELRARVIKRIGKIASPIILKR